MKPVLILVTVLAFASGGSVSQQKVATRTGTSTHFKTQDSQGNYRFGYDVVHSSGSSFHKEESSNGVKVGSYGLRDIDGRVRVVNYVADAQGFRADVRTNEPGVEPMKDPAGATISRPPPVAALPPVDFTADEPSSAAADEPSDEDEEAVATVTAEPTVTLAEIPATPEGTADVPAALSTNATSGHSTVVPPVSVEPIEKQPGAAKDTDTPVSAHAGGDVAPPAVLTDADDVSAKPPPRRRTKPRPPVFPPSPSVPSESPPPAAKEIGGESSGPSPKRPGVHRGGTPPRRTVDLPRYPFYVDAADVHIVGPAFHHPAPAVPFHRRPGGFQVAAFHGGFPFKVASARPFSPTAFGYFPAGVPQLPFAPRHPAAFHPAFYANPALASAFFHSAQLSHAGFPFGQLKWPYHAPFLPPVVAFPF